MLRHRGDAGSGQGLWLNGPLVNVGLATTQQHADAVGIARTSTQAMLLVDTGADITCVDDRIPAQLGLVPIRFRPLMGVNGVPEDRPVYRMSILVGMASGSGGMGQAEFTADVVGLPAPAYATAYAGLLGRDFLAHVRFSYDGPAGTYELVDYKAVSTVHRPQPSGPDPAAKRAKAKQQKKARRKNRR